MSPSMLSPPKTPGSDDVPAHIALSANADIRKRLVPLEPISAIEGTETLVPAPTKPIEVPVIHYPASKFPVYGDNVLLVIPTENANKVRILTEAFRKKNTRSGVEVHELKFPVDSEVGEQPYDEAGLQGATNRIVNALREVAKLNLVFLPTEYDGVLFRQKKIGTVIVASIENFIDTISDKEGRAVDYGLVTIHNVTTGKTVAVQSDGVTIPARFLEIARSFGFEDDDERHGCLTVGEVMATRVEGVDKADWHKVVAGKSRYDLLAEAIDGLKIPW